MEGRENRHHDKAWQTKMRQERRVIRPARSRLLIQQGYDFRNRPNFASFFEKAFVRPTNQQGTRFVSASSATHVQASPQPCAFFSSDVFFSLEPTKLQISSHWMRSQGRFTSLPCSCQARKNFTFVAFPGKYCIDAVKQRQLPLAHAEFYPGSLVFLLPAEDTKLIRRPLPSGSNRSVAGRVTNASGCAWRRPVWAGPGVSSFAMANVILPAWVQRGSKLVFPPAVAGNFAASKIIGAWTPTAPVSAARFFWMARDANP